jgi:hypothetical protein
VNNEIENDGKANPGDEAAEERQPLDSVEEDTIVLDTDSMDNVGDLSVEINVDELVAKIEANDDAEAREKLEARRKLDALAEQRKAEEDLGDTYNINLDEV